MAYLVRVHVGGNVPVEGAVSAIASPGFGKCITLGTSAEYTSFLPLTFVAGSTMITDRIQTVIDANPTFKAKSCGTFKFIRASSWVYSVIA